MPRGGKREGAGRKKGALTKRTQAIAAQAVSEGKAPLDVMLENMNHFQQIAIDAESVIAGMTADEIVGKSMSPDEQFKFLLAKAKHAAGVRHLAHECAKDAAPYIHPRLAATEVTGKDGGPIETMTNDPRSLARAVLAVLREAEIGEDEK